MATTLVVTNDFPPRIGGIESFVADVCELCDHDVVVLASSSTGAAAYDRSRPFEVVRTGPLLLPTARQTARAVDVLRRTGATRVLFGAAMPLGLMAATLRHAGAERVVALSHGHEAWWASVPVGRSLLRRVADELDALSTISDYVAGRLQTALSPAGRERLCRLPPPVDTAAFRPGDRRAPSRCVAVGRFVARKGFVGLLAAWRLVLAGWSGSPLPELVLVGAGPQQPTLARLAQDPAMAGTVSMTGALPRPAVVEQLQAARVFALPVRRRLGGLDSEGLGLAGLEAAACGLPVVVGDSGGAPETVEHGRSGYVVDPDDPLALARRIGGLLSDPELAERMGAAGRRRVVERFGVERARATLRTMLALP